MVKTEAEVGSPDNFSIEQTSTNERDFLTSIEFQHFSLTGASPESYVGNFKLSTQLLHAYKLCFDDGIAPLEYMEGLEVKGNLPANFEAIIESLFGSLK